MAVARNSVPRIPTTVAIARVPRDVDVAAVIGEDGAEGAAAVTTELAELARADADFATVADGGAEGGKEEDEAGEEGDCGVHFWKVVKVGLDESSMS